MDRKIDFVILWVDGSDPKWLIDKNKYSNNKTGDAVTDNRFRDWGNLKYWFRGVEKYASWVNKIYFITYGHIPNWLNTDNSKLVIVKHEDYIPNEYLPTFNSNVIELNLNKIADLSEHFVLFNDDMFIINKTSPEDFFDKNGLPLDECEQNANISYGKGEQIAHAQLNDIDIINRNFDKRVVMKKHFTKFINVKYGILNLRTIFLLPWYAFSGFYNPHIPISHLKSTFDEVWKKEKDMLEKTCENRFREFNDVNHWVFRYWNLCNGKFVPRSYKFGIHYEVSKENKEICDGIIKQKSKVICVNDSANDYDFEKAKNDVSKAFETILSEKSSFEK